MDAEMMEAAAEQAATSGQNDVVRDLLTLARQLINQGKPSQALQARRITCTYYAESSPYHVASNLLTAQERKSDGRFYAYGVTLRFGSSAVKAQ